MRKKDHDFDMQKDAILCAYNDRLDCIIDVFDNLVCRDLRPRRSAFSGRNQLLVQGALDRSRASSATSCAKKVPAFWLLAT